MIPGKGVLNIILLIIVYVGIQHYTWHHCIAAAAVAALLFIGAK